MNGVNLKRIMVVNRAGLSGPMRKEAALLLAGAFVLFCLTYSSRILDSLLQRRQIDAVKFLKAKHPVPEFALVSFSTSSVGRLTSLLAADSASKANMVTKDLAYNNKVTFSPKSDPQKKLILTAASSLPMSNPKNIAKAARTAKHVITTIKAVSATVDHTVRPRNLLQKNMKICDFPKLDPFDPSILHFYTKSKTMVCSKVSPNLFAFQDLKYNWNNTEAMLAKVPKDYFCRHRCATKQPSDRSAKYSDWAKFSCPQGFTATCDVTQIQCTANSSFTQVDFDRTYLHIVPLTTSNKNRIGWQYNVALIMHDALSRSNYIRQLPKTYEYLKRLNLVDFKRHIKVGENTEPNIFAFLTGRPPNSKSFPNAKGPYDEWPLLFKYLKSKGYLTYMIEDWDVGNSFVQYGSQGFLKQPTSHYPRPFWLTMWNSQVHKKSSQFCYNDQPYHNISLTYMLEFYKAYPEAKKFSLTMLEQLTHDILNAGGRGDEHYLKALKDIQQYLNNTFLIMFSDHGIRYHAIRRTRIGRIESSLPFLGIIMPKKFEEEHADLARTLRSNSDVGITSVYDLHYTIRVIADNFQNLPKPEDAIGQSLFQPIPANRTCAQAGVPNAYCVCQKDIEVNVTAPWVNAAALAIVKRMNEIVKPYPGCAEMTLQNVTRVSIKIQSGDTTEDPQTLRPGIYFSAAVLTISVNPSDGVVEADVVLGEKGSRTDGQWQVDGAIARINKYGDQPHCITDDLARMYCYCRS